MGWSSLVKWIPIPPEWKEITQDPTKMWRSMVSLLLMVGIVHIAWACGWLEWAGAQGVAHADELEAKIDAQLEPVRQEINQLKESVNQIAESQKVQSDRLSQSLKWEYDERIRAAIRSWCRTGDQDEQDRIRRNILDMKDEYEELTGEEYDEPTCDAV